MKRSKATAFYAISCLVCCLSAGMTVRQAAAEVEIWPVPDEARVTMLETKFRKDSHIWKRSDPTVRLAAAGGEHAYFQLVAAVELDTLEDVIDIHHIKIETGKDRTCTDERFRIMNS